MAKLAEKTPCADMLPRTIGSVTLAEILPGQITSIQPFKGKAKAVSDILKENHGLALPSVGRTSSKEGRRVLWAGKDTHIALGFEVTEKLEGLAGFVDQSDGWCIVELSGEDAESVLSRLVPVDVRGKTFKRGHTCKTMVEHVGANLTRVGENRFEIIVFRSMAKTLIHEVERAMAHVLARSGN